MKKVYVITFHCAYNVGAMLQCYSLTQAIKKIGNDVEVIDFKPVKVRNEAIEKIINKNAVQKASMYTKFIMKYLVRFVKYEFKKNKRCYIFVSDTPYRFAYFMKKKLPLTMNSFYKEDELQCLDDGDAIFISGSDQIWNLSLSDCPEAYLLGFVKKGLKNAYAASFGKTIIEEAFAQNFKSTLRDFSIVSVRERSGIKIVNDLAGKKAEWVLDPVFLLNKTEWKKLTYRPKIRDPYIFVYRMENNSEFLKQIEILKNKNSKIKVVQFDDFDDDIKADYQCPQKGPVDFLSYLFFSEFVLTNSFHGTAFSIIAKKNAIIIPHSCYNERIVSLMEAVSTEKSEGVFFIKEDVYSKLNTMIEKSNNVLNQICKLK